MLPGTLIPAEDRERVDELRLRLRLLRGEHEQDARQALTALFGLERSDVMAKALDVAANAYPDIHNQLAALYHYAPRVSGPFPEVLGAVERAGHWTQMVRGQRDTLALGDLAVVVEVNAGRVQLRTVTPDLWTGDVRAKRADPKALAYFAAWFPAGSSWELWEYEVEDAEGNPTGWVRRRTQQEIADRVEAAAVPITTRDELGELVMPVVLYHHADTGTLTDWKSGRDVTRGAMRIILYMTHIGHVIAEAAWPQRVLVDGEPVSGSEVEQGTGRQVIIADPATVLQVRSVEGKQALVTSWTQGADVEALFRVVAMYAKNVLTRAGVRSPEATRNESDIRSGYSLAVSREAIAEAQAVYAPVFRRSDQLLLHTVALYMGLRSAMPEVWTVDYQAVELGAVELAARADAAQKLMAGGLMSRRTALLFLHPGWGTREVDAELAAIDADAPTHTPTDPPPGA